MVAPKPGVTDPYGCRGYASQTPHIEKVMCSGDWSPCWCVSVRVVPAFLMSPRYAEERKSWKEVESAARENLHRSNGDNVYYGERNGLSGRSAIAKRLCV